MSIGVATRRDMVRRARWWQWCGAGAIVASLPSAIWRVLVGIGLPLGTPGSWRASQQVPGRGTASS
jgi:fumarate reductase subunit D